MWSKSSKSSNKRVTIMLLKQNLLQVISQHCGIKAKTTTSHNPQAKLFIKQIHKGVNDILRSFDLESYHENLEEQKDNPFHYFLQSTVWTIRSTYHTTLQATLYQLMAEI
jgi:hypothetical protein